MKTIKADGYSIKLFAIEPFTRNEQQKPKLPYSSREILKPFIKSAFYLEMQFERKRRKYFRLNGSICLNFSKHSLRSSIKINRGSAPFHDWKPRALVAEAGQQWNPRSSCRAGMDLLLLLVIFRATRTIDSIGYGWRRVPVIFKYLLPAENYVDATLLLDS